jgi:CDP-glucose 4,6-dehydratase
LESLVIDAAFWKDKTVLVTGHTGFKGAWLVLWLHALGAKVIGYALTPATTPNLFSLAEVEKDIQHIVGDVRDYTHLSTVSQKHQPEVIFHLAAQALVLPSYHDPAATYATNVMGTVNLLEAVRQLSGPRVVVNVTTDKCYENKEWDWAYREIDRLGGYDPYSSSKACSELVTSAYRRSFFQKDGAVLLASARAGNVIGGGDWSPHRLIPDVMRAYASQETLHIRYPHAIRPWQHVLEPLGGYLLLAQRLHTGNAAYQDAWNFGPDEQDVATVGVVVKNIAELLHHAVKIKVEDTLQLHEAKTLKLDCAKAKINLSWRPRWNLRQGILQTVKWYKAHAAGENMRSFTLNQIKDFMSYSTNQSKLMEIECNE